MIPNKHLVQFWHCLLPATCLQTSILSTVGVSVLQFLPSQWTFMLFKWKIQASFPNQKVLSFPNPETSLRYYNLFFSPWSIYWKSRILTPILTTPCPYFLCSPQAVPSRAVTGLCLPWRVDVLCLSFISTLFLLQLALCPGRLTAMDSRSRIYYILCPLTCGSIWPVETPARG